MATNHRRKHPQQRAERVSATQPRRIAPPPQVTVAADHAGLQLLRTLAGSLLVVAVTLVIYLRSVAGDFVFDDEMMLTENPAVRAPDGLATMWFSTSTYDYWPMTTSMFWFEWRLWGINPVGYHAVNIALHVVAALLIWKVLHTLSIPGAFPAAVLFAVHPLNVESVAWISQRKNTLSMVFLLLALWAYFKAELEHKPPWRLASLMAFALGMLSKGSIAPLPVLILILLYWRRPLTRSDGFRLAPFFVIAVVLTLVNVWFQTHDWHEEIRHVTILQRCLQAGKNIHFYLFKAFVPLRLSFIYPMWRIDVTDWTLWATAASTLTVTGLLWRARASHARPVLIAWLFFCAALAPALGFADVYFFKYSLVSDHYAHTAILSVVTLVAAAWTGWWKRERVGAEIAAVLVVAALTFLSWRQSGLYRSPATLWEATLAENPACTVAHVNLGKLHQRAGDLDRAVLAYRTALRLESTDRKIMSIAHSNLGVIELQRRRFEAAREELEKAIRSDKDNVDAHTNLGNALAESGQNHLAIQQYGIVIAAVPHHTIALRNRATVLRRTGRHGEAIADLEKALRYDPEYFDAMRDLAQLTSIVGDLPQAERWYVAALARRPDMIELHQGLAKVYVRANRSVEAIRVLESIEALARQSGRVTLAKEAGTAIAMVRDGRNPFDDRPSATAAPASD